MQLKQLTTTYLWDNKHNGLKTVIQHTCGKKKVKLLDTYFHVTAHQVEGANVQN